jgi:hypothetical protein
MKIKLIPRSVALRVMPSLTDSASAIALPILGRVDTGPIVFNALPSPLLALVDDRGIPVIGD